MLSRYLSAPLALFTRCTNMLNKDFGDTVKMSENQISVILQIMCPFNFYFNVKLVTASYDVSFNPLSRVLNFCLENLKFN